MNVTLSFSILLFLIFLWSCESKPSKEYLTSDAAFIDLSKKELIPHNLEEVINDYEVIPLEYDENSKLLKHADKIIEYQNRFYVLDMHLSALKVYDKTGKFLFNIGSIGSGPGEYTSLFPSDIQIFKNELYLFNNSKLSIIKYNLEGTYQSEMKLGFYPYDFQINKDGSYFFYINNNPSEKSENFNLIHCNNKGKIIGKNFPFNKNFGSSISFSGFLENNLYASPLSDTIFQVDENKISIKYIINVGKLTLPKEYKISYQKFFQQGLNYSYLLSNAFETDNFFYFGVSNQREPAMIFYNKAKKKVFWSDNKDKKEIFHFLRIINGITEDRKKFIATLDSDQISEIIENKYVQGDELKALLKVKNHIGQVIFILKLKQ